MEDVSPHTTSSRGLMRLPVSLRTRLIAANILIIAVSIASLGYYVYYRAQETTKFLTSELDSSVRQKAVDSLTASIVEQANGLNGIFTAVRKDVAGVGLSTNLLLVNEGTLDTTAYWDATKSLARLPNGSWDNPSTTDPASIFIPARVELTESLATELNALKQLDFVAPTRLQANQDVIAIYFGGRSGETLYYPNIDLANVVPPDFDVTQRPWYVAASPVQDPTRTVTWSTPYLDAARQGLVITGSFPIYDGKHGFRGVVAMDLQLNRLSYIVSSIHVGATGYGFVVDKDGRLIAMPDVGYKDLGMTPEAAPLGQALDQDKLARPLPAELLGVIAKMRAGQSGFEVIKLGSQERYIIYRPVPEVGYSLAIMVPSAEMLAGAAAAKQTISMSATNTQQISFVLVALDPRLRHPDFARNWQYADLATGVIDRHCR